MKGRRRIKDRQVRVRNPLVPVVRALAPRVKPSAKAYTRKVKHKRRGREGGEPLS